jgi:hypothetical protein
MSIMIGIDGLDCVQIFVASLALQMDPRLRHLSTFQTFLASYLQTWTEHRQNQKPRHYPRGRSVERRLWIKIEPNFVQMMRNKAEVCHSRQTALQSLVSVSRCALFFLVMMCTSFEFTDAHLQCMASFHFQVSTYTSRIYVFPPLDAVDNDVGGGTEPGPICSVSTEDVSVGSEPLCERVLLQMRTFLAEWKTLTSYQRRRLKGKPLSIPVSQELASLPPTTRTKSTARWPSSTFPLSSFLLPPASFLPTPPLPRVHLCFPPEALVFF